MSIRQLAIVGFILSGLAADAARGQCGYEWEGEVGPGVVRQAYAAVEWDPDGAGPQPSLLVVGANFPDRVHTWDGHTWSELGPLVGAPAKALVVFEGQLYALASLGVYRWDGSIWQRLGSTLIGATCLTVYNGRLVAGGSFSLGPSYTKVASWNGSAWEPVGPVNDSAGNVYALTVWNGSLVAGGNFSSIGGVTCSNAARWDGTTWAPLGSLSGRVYAVAVRSGDLYMAGELTSPGYGVARWDGTSWQSQPYYISKSVYALHAYGGDLILGGDFTIGASSCLARDTGTGWAPLVSSTSSIVEVRGLTTYVGRLVAVGPFTRLDETGCLNVAAWDGTGWQAFGRGMNAGVRSLLVADGQLFASGGFTTAGTSQARRLARYTGADWESLDLPLSETQQALAWFEGDLIATVRSTVAALSPSYVARRTPSGWETLGEPLSGGTRQVYALAVHDGTLVAAGDFISSGEAVVNRIARWSGTAWEPFGDGMNGPVRALASFNGDLVAGGDFTLAGGVTCNGIARWDGTAWQPLGDGVTGCASSSCPASVRALYVYRGRLVAGGTFLMAGGVTCNRIAQWDGVSWSALKGGSNSTVNAFCVLRDRLVAGGHFSAIDGLSTLGLAAWDGAKWLPIPSGANPVYALAVHEGALVIGGDFIATRDQPFPFFVRRVPVGPFEPTDYNRDCQVDVADLSVFTACRSGPAIPILDPACADRDLDDDLDVDQSDFGMFQASLQAVWPFDD